MNGPGGGEFFGGSPVRIQPNPAYILEPAYRGCTWRHLSCDVSGGQEASPSRRHLPWPRCPPCCGSAPPRAPENIYSSSAPPAAQLRCIWRGCTCTGGGVADLLLQRRRRQEVWRESGARYGGIREGEQPKRRRDRRRGGRLRRGPRHRGPAGHAVGRLRRKVCAACLLFILSSIV